MNGHLTTYQVVEPHSFGRERSYDEHQGRRALRASGRHAPKVRTGCFTCKFRKIKCDERRGGCSNCAKKGVQCGGYIVTNPTTNGIVQKKLLPKPGQILAVQTKIEPKRVRPRKNTSTLVLAILPADTLAIDQPRMASPEPLRTIESASEISEVGEISREIPVTLHSCWFDNSQQSMYFQRFLNTTASRLGGRYSRGLWETIIPRACASHSVIRHAVVALAALDLTNQIQQRRAVDDAGLSRIEEAGFHHQRAIEQYGKSLRDMSRLVEESSSRAVDADVRIILLASLLAFCFETLHGDRHSAITHARSGVSVCLDWYERKSLDSGESDWSLVTTSPVPNMIEDELVQAFVFVSNELNFSYTLQRRPVHLNSNEQRWAELSKVSIPAEFESLEEAKRYLDLCRRLSNQGYVAVLAFGQEQLKKVKAGQDIPDWRHIPEWANENFLQQCNYAAWMISFQPLVLAARESDIEHELVSVLTLLLRAKATLLACHTVVSEAEEPDVLSQEWCLEFVQLAVEIQALNQLKYGDARPSFTFDGFFLGSMHIFISRCPDPILRRWALALVKQQPLREGIWDGMVSARISELHIELEEAALRHQRVSYDRRLVQSHHKFDPFERKGSVTFFKQHPKTVAEPHKNVVEFTW